MNVTCCYGFAKNAAITAIGFSIRAASAYISRSQQFWMSHSLPQSLKTLYDIKNAARSIDQSDNRKLTWAIIKNFAE